MRMLTSEELSRIISQTPDNLRIEPLIVAIDFETPNNKGDRACSIGLTLIRNGSISDSFEYLINPDTYFDERCVNIHGITPNDVKDAPEFPSVWNKISHLFEDSLVIAHNACFDLSVLKHLFQHYGIDFPAVRYADTVTISRNVYGKLMPNHKLGTLCSELEIPLDAHHAGSDSYGCAAIYLKMLAKRGSLKEFEKIFDF